MNRRFAVTVLFLLLALACNQAGAYDQFGGYTWILYSDPSFCVQYACDNCTPPLRFPIADFSDPLLAFAKLRSVDVFWQTGNDYQGFSWQNIPTVALDLNGTPIATQTVSNFVGCDLISLPPSTYVFQSADYTGGFPGYVRNGTNTLFLTLETPSSAVSRGIGSITLSYELPPPFAASSTSWQPSPRFCIRPADDEEG